MQAFDFELKKRPKQKRSQVTFDAIIEACTRVLADNGYGGTTTNHIAEAAGVCISSLYEYFPNKDAVIAQVAEQFVNRVLARIGLLVPEIQTVRKDQAMSFWLYGIHDILIKERKLLKVFLYEVPYTNQLPAIKQLFPMLTAFSNDIRHTLNKSTSNRNFSINESAIDMRLMINLTTTTITQLVLHPKDQATTHQTLDVLAKRLERWIAE